ncbi:TetR/AcrR family transcriptional regulator [Streptomyces pactum]|uniref:TetR/AcrR family transcriptional regulator n=1 Tax=Streptomyces pactum TaxID=68249 RepID=A0ABS0NP57_9ACTN|nr:TetR/AcrR family transcriptional regulator [Streptomyces pactum]MBH5336967.1 TetR/AcrR family transcriptional regulator [Streptomyces pactum]
MAGTASPAPRDRTARRPVAAALPSRRPSARERILTTATALFDTHGIRGVGVDRIIAESGVAKATLYAHFRAKDDLVLAYLRETDRNWRDILRGAAAAAGEDPRDQLLGLFDALRECTLRDGFRGCPFIKTAGESTPGSAVHTATVEHKQAVRDWLTELTAAAGAADPRLLALQLAALVDGVMAAAALEPVAAVPDAAREAARVLVERACPARD